MKEKKSRLSLYVHIPFCVRKCLYCDFLSFPVCRFTENEINEYTDLLCTEIKTAAKELAGSHELYSVFIGGGTPTVLPPEELLKIDSAIAEGFHLNEGSYIPEYTIEVNPGTCTDEITEALKKMHVNRVSIGLQSAADDELKKLGRIHDFRTFSETYHKLKNAGFDNINVDIMSDIPGQTVKSYRDTLEKVINLGPEHISAYSLIIEPGTPFFEMYEQGKLDIPDEDTDRLMYHETKSILAEKGYTRYEISNYSLPGYECRHNLVYWSGGEYFGAGSGASSMLAARGTAEAYGSTRSGMAASSMCAVKGGAEAYGSSITCQRMSSAPAVKETPHISADKGEGTLYFRFKNPDDLKGYREHVKRFKALSEEYIFRSGSACDEMTGKDISGCFEITEEAGPKEAMEEFFFLGLRKTSGVSADEFEKLFGKNVNEIYGEAVQDLEKNGLLVYDRGSGNIRLTDRGLDLSNYCMEKFLLQGGSPK